MHRSIENLFEYTRDRVTDQDIIDFSPSDPGYGEYVSVWKKIRRSGVIPKDCPFEVSEVIALTGWAKAEQEKEPNNFRRYRRFTTAVGVVLLNSGFDSDFVRPANYIARDLLIDLDTTCETHLALLRAVVGPTRDVLASSGCEEGYPFFTFARLILAQIAEDWRDAHEAATRLIEDERSARERFDWMVQDERFLLGISNCDQLHGDWLTFAGQLRNPTQHPDTEAVMTAFRRAQANKTLRRRASGAGACREWTLLLARGAR